MTSFLHKAGTAIQTHITEEGDFTEDMNEFTDSFKFRNSPDSRRAKLDIPTIKERLRVVYDFYAIYGDKSQILKVARFHKFVEDAQLPDKKITKPEIDILFASFGVSSLSFDLFLDALTRIAEIKFELIKHKLGVSVAFRTLLLRHLLPLHDRILLQTANLEEITFDEAAAEVLASVLPALSEIYMSYYPQEVKEESKLIQTIKRSQPGQSSIVSRITSPNPFSGTSSLRNSMASTAFLKNLYSPQRSQIERSSFKEMNSMDLRTASYKSTIKFLQDFGISPGILPNSSALVLWRQISRYPTTKSPEQSQVVKRLFVGKDEAILHKDDSAGREQATAVFGTLEESSSVYAPVAEKNKVSGIFFTFASFLDLLILSARVGVSGATTAQKITFLLESMQNSKKFSELFNQREKKAYSLELAPRRTSPTKSRMPTPPSSNISAPSQSIASEERNEVLQHIFQRACNYGQPLNTTKLSLTNFTKFLQDCGVITTQRNQKRPKKGKKALTQVELDLVLSKVTPTRSKLNFKEFLRTLKLLARREYRGVEEEEAFSVFL